MDRETVIIVLKIHRKNITVDLQVPLNITTNDLVLALDVAYGLGIDVNDINKCYLKAENPIALLRGNKELREYGIRNGSIINFTE